MNKTFCILPWVHFFHDTEGYIRPCCNARCKGSNPADQRISYNTMRDHSDYMDIINQPAFNELRNKMLRGEESEECTYCYEVEKHGGESPRLSKNSMLNLDKMINMEKINEMTNPDGSLKDFRMKFWDVRFNNICNISCRMCSPMWSHTWAKEEEIKINGSYIINAHDTDKFKEIVSKYGPLDELYDIFFAGGEVLFQKEHWEMLDYLIEIGNTDVMLNYVTNLTKLDYDNFKLLEYIPKFKDVTLTVSLDATKDLLEYIRWGSVWKDIVNNLNAVRDLENVHLRVNHTTTLYNLLSLPSTIDFLYDNEYLNEEYDIDLSIAPEPHNHVGAFPLELKEQAKEKILKSKYYPLLKIKLDAVIDTMLNTTYDFPKEYINKLDKRRNCDITNVIPELKPYIK